ncbi:MAG: hypothetical protein QOJ38_188 [Solirubrobacterales bacterium]|nr:hypothetical protein [Solirubrobacterales bacterium]
MLLWWLARRSRQLGALLNAIRDPENEKLVSAASIWEIEIKRVSGRLDAPDDIADALAATGFNNVPITPQHAIAAARLPAHHSDPFDRMLVAQAQVEGLIVATVDPRIAAYGVAVIGAEGPS